MPDTIKWKGEVTFEGSPEQLKALLEGFAAAKAKINIPEWAGRIRHLAGCSPLPIKDFLKQEHLDRLIKGARMVNVGPLVPIPGGIRVPHIHVGDQIALVNQEQFRQYAGELAKAMADRRVSAIDDYTEAMMPIGALDVKK